MLTSIMDNLVHLYLPPPPTLLPMANLVLKSARHHCTGPEIVFRKTFTVVLDQGFHARASMKLLYILRKGLRVCQYGTRARPGETRQVCNGPRPDAWKTTFMGRPQSLLIKAFNRWLCGTNGIVKWIAKQ
jgi:hypothetical protein